MVRKIVSLVLKAIIVLSAVTGVIMQATHSSTNLLFFTLQSNIWIAVTCLVGIVLILIKKPLAKWMYSVKLIFTVSITLTGVVFCTMLAPLLGNLAYTIDSVLLHVVTPVASIADFFVYDTKATYRKWECLTVTIPPFYYLGFAGIGYVLNWDFGYGGLNYPYFFLNWGSPAGAFGFSTEAPYIGVVYYVLILLAFVIGIGALYIGLAKLINRKAIDNDSKQT